MNILYSRWNGYFSRMNHLFDGIFFQLEIYIIQPLLRKLLIHVLYGKMLLLS
jgi:hypothetical protein